jgi:hypothetical protein
LKNNKVVGFARKGWKFHTYILSQRNIGYTKQEKNKKMFHFTSNKIVFKLAVGTEIPTAATVIS